MRVGSAYSDSRVTHGIRMPSCDRIRQLNFESRVVMAATGPVQHGSEMYADDSGEPPRKRNLSMLWKTITQPIDKHLLAHLHGLCW